MAEFIEILSKTALADVKEANTEVIKLISNIDKAGESLKGMKTPSGSDSAIKKLISDYDTLAKTNQNLQKALVKEQQDRAKTVQSILNQSKSYQDLAKQKERSLAQSAKEEAMLTKSNNLYNQTQLKVNQLSQTYNNLAIKKELGGKLTANEVIQLHKLTNELNIYQSALKKVDADIQKNQRNVGNYASGWNGLGNSINQLSREMPAFANSAQTGFMALSNNLPILFDEIERIKTANKELLAQGQPIKSVFSQVAGAVFSMGTALSVGVTLLTIFGPKLWDMVAGTKASKEAIEQETKAREEKAQIEKQAFEQQVKYASEEQAKAKILLETAKNLTLSMKERKAAVAELQQRYPDYLGKLSQEEILAGNTADAEYRLNDALMKRALFLAVQDKIIEKTKELVAEEFKYLEANSKGNKADELYDITTQKKITSKEKLRLASEKDLATTKGLEFVVKNADKTNVNSTSIYNEKTLAIKRQLDVLYAMLNGNMQYNSVVNDEIKAKEKLKKVEEQLKIFTEAWFQSEISRLEEVRSKVADTTLEYASYTNQVNVLKMLLLELQGIENPDTLTQDQLDALDEGIKKMKSFEEATVKTSKASNDWIKSFSENFFGSAGFPTMFKILNDEIDGFGEKFTQTFLGITEVAQEAFNFITEASNANFANEYRNLEQQKEIALLFAGDSASAREEIERQSEQRRKQIAKREFEAKKQQALFNIAIDTAQAIIATLARTPLPAGLPFVIATGALGLAQATIVASQQAPQFWKGTDSAPEGFAWTQERGQEIITDSKGNIKDFGDNKGSRLTYLNKGDKVLNNKKTMDYLMFNDSLNSILTGNNISNPVVEVSNNTNFDKVGKEIVKAINDKPVHGQAISNGQLKNYVETNSQRIELTNKRINFTPNKV